MGKVASTVGKVAGTIAGIALIASGFGAPIGAGILGVSWGAIAASASLLGSLGGMGQKKPRAQGSVSQVIIGANAPQPYALGRTYIGGNLIHDVGYGGTVDKIKNPYRSQVYVWSVGPVDSIEAFQADFVTVGFSGTGATGYYGGWLHRSTQLGALPEASALSGPHGAIPQWGSTYRLSGYAAGLVSMKFDKDGKKFSSGVPQFGAILKGVKVYDPRLDSTYPGGAGTQRFADESTWTWSDNPALHALAYARGRYHNGKKVFGCGFSAASIDLAAFVELANVCDSNVWKVGGAIYEPASKWDNLKRILQAASAEPVFVGAKLSVKFSAPKIALDTITADDLADGEYQVSAMRSWRDRLNGIIPRYRSEAHKWEYVQSDLVSVATYVTEDGEEKHEERQYDLVQGKDQAAQLAAYDLVNGREFSPIVLPCKPRLIEYVPGEALNVDIPELGLNNQLCIITGRTVDPGTAVVTLTLESETTAKHAFALGQTGTAPPTPSITTGEELDDIVAENTTTTSDITNLINTSSQVGFTVTATDTSATLSNHARRYTDKEVAVTGSTLGSLLAETAYWFYYDDADRAGGAVTYTATTDYFEAFPSATNPYRHYAGYITTAATGGTTSGGGSLPPGGGGSTPYDQPPEPV